MGKVKKEEQALVTIHKRNVCTTSLKVAEVFGKQHKNVMQAIENLEVPDDFNRLNFQPIFFADSYGRQQPAYQITRDGFTVLAMGFTGKKAMQFKLEYIAAFNAMEQALSRQSNLLWQEQRQQGKLARREVTDVISRFIEYAKAQGSKNAHHYYSNITRATYKCLFIIKDNAGQSFRDMLDAMQLSFLQVAEYVASQAISDGMDDELHYKDIYQLAKERVERYAGSVPRTDVINRNQRLPMVVPQVRISRQPALAC